MYRVYVYRTNEKKEKLCYCISKKFDSLDMAEKFSAKQNNYPLRISEIHKI